MTFFESGNAEIMDTTVHLQEKTTEITEYLVWGSVDLYPPPLTQWIQWSLYL